MCLKNVFIMEMVSLAVAVVAYLAFAEMHWEVATSLEFLGPSFLAWE